MLKTGVFLDRDDTIIKDKGYLNNPDDIEILPGAVDAIKKLNESGFPVIIITNQSGIARGYFDEVCLEKIHKRLLSLLNGRGADIAGIYYCPHHPEGVVEAYTKVCDCRKPATGMLKAAAKRFNLDLKKCYMVGDHVFDVEAIHRVGGKGIFIDMGKKNMNPKDAEYIAKNLHDAVQWILSDCSNE